MVRTRHKKVEKGARHTLSAGIGLHKLGPGACLLKLRRKPRQLREDLVDDAHLGGEVVLVDVAGEEAANIPKAAHDEHRWFVRHGVFASKSWSLSVDAMRCGRAQEGSRK